MIFSKGRGGKLGVEFSLAEALIYSNRLFREARGIKDDDKTGPMFEAATLMFRQINEFKEDIGEQREGGILVNFSEEVNAVHAALVQLDRSLEDTYGYRIRGRRPRGAQPPGWEALPNNSSDA
jgi:hypothetical protein